VIDIPVSSEYLSQEEEEPLLTFDPEWLAITRAFHPFLSTTRHQPPFPEESLAREMVKNELEWVTKNVVDMGSGRIKNVVDCQQFSMTAPGPEAEGSATMQQRMFI